MTAVDAQVVRRYLPEIDWIEDDATREKVIAVWLEVCKESAWQVPFEMGFSQGIRRPTLAEHVRATVQGAVAMAEITETIHGLALDRQKLIVLGLLHDASKPLEYGPDEHGEPVKTTLGNEIQHAFYAAHLAAQQGFSQEMIHLILSHSPQSPISPQTPEGVLFAFVDLADARASKRAAGR